MPELKKYPYSDILGWSVSRYDKFSTCKRLYYYEYYATRHDSSVDRNLLLQLRSLTSEALETGHLLHEVIAQILERLRKSTAPVQLDKLEARVRTLVQDSLTKNLFFEEYYGTGTRPSGDVLFEKVWNHVQTFLNSARLSWLIREAIPHANDWLIEPPGYGETRLNGLKAYCKVDFMFPAEGKIYIMDWKTGKEDEAKQTRQLMGYVAFACDHLQKPAEEVETILYFFRDNTEKIASFNGEQIAQFAESIAAETEAMQACTTDINRNIPLPKEDFPLTDQTSRCRFCNYRKLCYGEVNI